MVRGMIFAAGFLCLATFASAKEVCLSGDCQAGHGLKRYTDGSTYEGGFEEGKRSGKGVLRHASGVVYEGMFENDLFEGEGRMIHADGRSYEGVFKEGAYHGPGRYRWANGATYEGDFSHGEFYTGTLVRADGTRRVYEQGKRLE